MVREQKQMGCMAGFLHHLRFYSAKTLPPMTMTVTMDPESESTSPEPEPEPEPQAPKTRLPLGVFEFKQAPTPRLSLDSRTLVTPTNTTHGDGDKQRRSTSVVARLMGLDDPSPPPDSDPQLRRCASESESRHVPQYRFFDTSNFQLKQNGRAADPKVRARGMGQKKTSYDSADFFPEPKQKQSVSEMQGIHDLDTLKQILEALHLKGLLHSNKPASTNQGNQSPIVVMKPVTSTNRTRCNSPPPFTPRPSRNNNDAYRNIRAPSQFRARNSSSPARSHNRITGPKLNSRRNAPDQQVTSRSPRLRKPTYHKGATEDGSFTSPHTDTERFKMEEYKEGRSLLERCDKLLSSIAEITTELQPSPVSVLDSSFYKDDSSCSPSPVMKRCTSIDYKDLAADWEDDTWSGAVGCSEAKWEEDSEDFVYVTEIVRASNYFTEDSDVFLLLEKQQHLKGNDTSKPSTLRRRLIFDTIHEILNRNRRLPPWKAVSWADNNIKLFNRIWAEFRRIRVREEGSEDLFEVICGVLRKDMAEDAMKEWGECPVEMGDVVLDIERLVFKDLIGETIRDLASFKFKRPKCNRVSLLRRKLVF